MKRYWKTISICLVTLLVIGTFYIQSSFAANNHVKIEFEKVSGNEDEVKHLMLDGHYPVGHMYQPLQITSEETIDPSNLSFLRKLERLSVPPRFDDLVKQHRAFMRSKYLMPNYFFENDNLIAYANIKAKNNVHPMTGLSFDIEVLNKETKEITPIQLDIPERENYGWMQVEDVQVIDGELKIITRGSRIKKNIENELRVYTFDVSEKKLLSDESIISIPAVENGWSDVRIINDHYSMQQNKFLLIKIEAVENEMVQSDGELNPVINEFMVYDLENNQSKKLAVPEEALNSINNASAILNSTLYIPSQSASGLEVHQYDIQNEKWGETLTYDLDSMDDENAPYMKVMNGKLYTVHSTDNGNTIFIGDLATGESLYEGKLKVKNEREDQKDFQLYIHEIEYVQ
ncbi:hypothetical protein AB1K83_10995 [Sporosarcina sp. 179-K 3D1 HS]|uniref:hypothetical protein n=1 Tax=Sporosarcina sp. 179-K 3D1 HS TaxID=3232169 RepID=UPI0039A21D6E